MRLKLSMDGVIVSTVNLSNPVDAEGGAGHYTYEGEIEGFHVFESIHKCSTIKFSVLDMPDSLKGLNIGDECYLKYTLKT